MNRFQRRFLRSRVVLLILALVTARSAAFAQNGKLTVAPPAAWVNPVRVVRDFGAGPATPGVSLRWRLFDRQINAKTDEQFFHFLRQVVNQDGAQKASHITFDYDPSYQSLTLHWARILRGTNLLNRLDYSRIQTTQHSIDPGRFLSGPIETATLLVDDARPGDLIDYAYSIEGGNPLLHGMFCASVPVQFDDPLEHFIARLVWPPPRRFYIQNHGTDIYPGTSYTNGMVEYLWTANSVPGLLAEPSIPVWYNPHPWVQLSEFQSWSDVNKWAMGLFPSTNSPSPELTRQIDEWKKLSGPEESAGAALRFVQEQIRSVAPSSDNGAATAEPITIFARRFGDAADKARLLVALMRGLNLDAWPMLVSARFRQTVINYHPSADLFDHIVVQVALNNQFYYLDPTASYERGPISVRSWPEYGYGLLVRAGEAALRAIPPCPVQPKTTVSEYFDVRGYDQETGVKIVTVAEGADAKALREHFVLTPLERIERDYLRTQEDFYPRIHSTEPLQFSDDEQNNRFQVVASYAIPGFWRRRPEDPYYHCRFYSFNVDDAMRKPEDSMRTMPLAINYPVHQAFHVEASWLTGWPVKPDTQVIRNPAFAFDRTMNIIGTNLVVDFNYRSTSDAVMPEAFPVYLRQLDAASQYLGCTVVSY